MGQEDFVADVKSWGPGNRANDPRLGTGWRDQIGKVQTGWKDEPEPALVASGYWGPTYDVAGMGSVLPAASGGRLFAAAVVGGFTGLATWWLLPRFATRWDGETDRNMASACAGASAATGVLAFAVAQRFLPFLRA